MDILNLQRTAGNAAVSRAIAARQPTGPATQTPEEEVEQAFFDDDWDRIVALAATRTSPLRRKAHRDLVQWRGGARVPGAPRLRDLGRSCPARRIQA